MRSYIIKTPL